MPKTIFITSLNPFVTRNILRTGVFQTLQQNKNLRIVIFCPDYKEQYFKDNFSGSNVVIEPIKSQIESRQDALFRFLTGALIDNRTRFIHHKIEYLKDRRFGRFLFSQIIAKLSHWRFIRRLVRGADFFTVSKKKFSRYFEQYRPDLVFAPDMFHIDDCHFLAEARWRKIKTVGMIRSWDNITNKGLFRIKPDYLIVHNEIIKNEAVVFEDMRPDRIFVSGIPQFDYYFHAIQKIQIHPNDPNQFITERSIFFKRIGLDPKKRLIMFSPHGKRFHDTDWQIMQILKEARRNGEIPSDVQVLVRFPANDDVDLGQFSPDDYFYIDRPSQSFRPGIFWDQELTGEAMIHLANSLHYSELIITYNSSIIIDAAVFGKPSIGIAFDGWEKKPDIYRSVARFMAYDHTQHLLKTGGLLAAKNRAELIKAVNVYLQNPDYNLENRKKILQTQCGTADGKAGERIAEFLESRI
jgi:hypothetical protein